MSLSLNWLDASQRPPHMTDRDLAALNAVGLVTVVPVLIALYLFLASRRLPLKRHRRLAGSVLLACGILTQFYLLGFLLIHWSP